MLQQENIIISNTESDSKLTFSYNQWRKTVELEKGNTHPEAIATKIVWPNNTPKRYDQYLLPQRYTENKLGHIPSL